MNALAPYRKTAAALVIAIIGWATAVVASESGPVVAAEWVGLATVVATALGVYGVANEPESKVV